MPALLLPLIIKIITLGLDYVFAKQAQKAAKEKALREAFAKADGRVLDASQIRAENQRGVGELNRKEGN